MPYTILNVSMARLLSFDRCSVVEPALSCRVSYDELRS